MRQLDDNFIYVKHLLAEHERLDHLIRRTLATFPNWEELDSTAWISRTIAGLKLIRSALTHHFRDEEQGGCLEEAVARCPALSADVQAIEAEHPQLLAELDSLIRRCGASTTCTANEAEEVQIAVQALVNKLRTHEALENRIMERGFGVCLEDREGTCQVR
jgi:hypothetical protein